MTAEDGRLKQAEGSTLEPEGPLTGARGSGARGSGASVTLPRSLTVSEEPENQEDHQLLLTLPMFNSVEGRRRWRKRSKKKRKERRRRRKRSSADVS